jgi:hypothetical protein
MRQIIQDLKTGQTILGEIPAPQLRRGCVLIQDNSPNSMINPNIYC